MREWVRAPLGELVTFQKGRKVPTTTEARAGYQPYLGASSLEGEPSEFAAPAGGIPATERDVLMLWDGERSGLCGRGQAGLVSSTVARLSPRPGVDAGFLFHALRHQFSWIQARRTGTGVPHVPKDLGSLLVFALPGAEDEQRRIARVLDSLGEAIQKTDQLIAKLEKTKQGLLHDLLTRGVDANGELRDPERHPERFVRSEWGRIPKEWDLRPLDEIRAPDSPITYGVLKPGEYVPGGVPLLQIEDVIHGELDQAKAHRIGPSLDAQYARTRVRGGELVISLVGTIGRVAQLPLTLGYGNLHRNLGLLRVRSEYVARFFLFCLSSAAGQFLIRRTTLGTTQSLLNLGALRALSVPVPTATEQEAIAANIDGVGQRISHESSHLEKLKLLRSGLMGDLLTGRVRVNDTVVGGQS